MPPVMGAGAFIMAEMTNIPYLEIIKVAAIPGILFYLSVGVMVYFESRKLGLRGLTSRGTTASRRGYEKRLVSVYSHHCFNGVIDHRLLARMVSRLRDCLRDRSKLDSAMKRAWGRSGSGWLWSKAGRQAFSWRP